MAQTIKDGATGNIAKVDTGGRLRTFAISKSEISSESEDNGQAFGLSTPMLTLTTSNGRMGYIKNTSTTRNLTMVDLWFHWNGGSTNFNRTAIGEFIFGEGAPTTNNTASAAGVLNRSSQNTAEVTWEYWDQVGTGMTGGTAGGVAFTFAIGQGQSFYAIDGAIVLGPGDTMAFSFKGEEIGELSINVLFYMGLI